MRRSNLPKKKEEKNLKPTRTWMSLGECGHWLGNGAVTEGAGCPGTGNHAPRGEKELPSGRQGCLLSPRLQGVHARLN